MPLFKNVFQTFEESQVSKVTRLENRNLENSRISFQNSCILKLIQINKNVENKITELYK